MKLYKSLILLDLETTGTSIQHDRIIQIAVIKIDMDSVREKKTHLINPGIPIPPGATEIHGITDAMVAGKPMFKEIAKAFKDYCSGCDLGGYNSDSFDIPMLIAEFHRCQIEFPDWELNFIDSYKIEQKLNSHSLSDVYRRYTGNDLDDAHDAMIDAEATETVLMHQLDIIESMDKQDGFDPDDVTPEFIDNWCQGENKRFDYAGKTYIKDGIVYWSFGKNKDEPVLDDRGYLNWFLNADFPIQSKKIIKELLISKQS